MQKISFRTLARYTPDAAIILVCVVLLGVVGREQLKRFASPYTRERAERALVGRTVSGLPQSTRRNAVVTIAVAPKCPYCVKSIPFYQELTRAANQSGGMFAVAVKFVSDGPVSRYLDENQLGGAISLGRLDPSLPIAGTPTMLLSDRTDRIVKGWVGYLDEGQRRDVYASIARLCPDCKL